MKIAYWGDISCPYSYIGTKNLKKAVAELELDPPPELEFHSFELNPEGTAAAELLSADEEAYCRAAEKAGQAVGLDIHCRNAVRASTRNAHRLIKKAQSQGGSQLAENVADDLFHAYFTDGLDVSSLDVLAEIGERNGLDRGDVAQILAGEEYLDEVLHDEHALQAMNITSVPFFLINDKYAFTGAIPPEQMLVILEKIRDDAMPTA